ncbi:hypothetical protein Pla52o_13320 [Novipirellula galeiformis]|uniref:Uncharacterized protein n=1 Tax=Novipirellula galeiformis TaxID=2528004 RepID=A0A5C6CLT9_9BACT|nr:hypothetical protein Pla52o_13320 [Novipirellula galeiformis]
MGWATFDIDVLYPARTTGPVSKHPTVLPSVFDVAFCLMFRTKLLCGVGLL